MSEASEGTRKELIELIRRIARQEALDALETHERDRSRREAAYGSSR